MEARRQKQYKQTKNQTHKIITHALLMMKIILLYMKLVE